MFGQISTNPELANTGESFQLIFDATGTTFEGYDGELYAHTGVTIDDNHWQNVIESWGNNETQPQFNKIDEDLYVIEITPNVYEFYNVPSDANITGIDIVVRSADAATQTGDLSVELYQEGYVISLTSPADGASFQSGDNITIQGIANNASELKIFIDNQEVKSVTAAEITYETILNQEGNHTIKLSGTLNGETLTDERTIYISPETPSLPLPSGMKDGINVNGNEVTFVLAAPGKSVVYLFGDFNDWSYNTNYQMNKAVDRFWLTVSNLDPDQEYAYQYNIDGNIQIADPHAYKVLDPFNDQYISDEVYPNLKSYPEEAEGIVSVVQINKPEFTWEDDSFVRPSMDNSVIYELLIRDFTEEGTYKAVIERLDYLQGLGVTAIELLPVNEFEGNESWGYNPSFFRALDKAYGTENDLKSLVNEAHKRGISILLDVVLNHSFGQSPLLAMYWNEADGRPASDNPWYNETSNFENPNLRWGQDFDHESEYTTQFFKDILSYWIEEFHIDGYRFDFTKGLSNTYHSIAQDEWGSNYDADRVRILKDYVDYLTTNHGEDLGIIFEHLADNSEEKELADYGIYMWVNGNHNWNQNIMGYNEDSSITWTDYKAKNWNDPRAINYMESHDEERLMYKTLSFGKEDGNYDVRELPIASQRQEGAHLIAQALRGPKMIWQFGELGYDISIDEGGRTSPKPVLWEYDEDPYRKHIYSTIATINKFKQQYPSFNSNTYTFNETGLQKSLIIEDNEMNIVILVNFDTNTSNQNVEFPSEETYYDYFEGKHVEGGTQNISLKAGGYKLYTTKVLQDPLTDGSGDTDNDGVSDDLDQCPNTRFGTAVDENGCPKIQIAADNFTLETFGLTCPGINNGELQVMARESYGYQLELAGQTYDFSNDLSITDLSPGTYDIKITVDEDSTFEAVYQIKIDEAPELSLINTTQVFGDHTMSSIQINQGTAPYQVFINGRFAFDTNQNTIQVKAKHGDAIQIETAVPCEGEESIYMPVNPVSVYPNPAVTETKLELLHPNIQEVSATVFNQLGLEVTRFQLVKGQIKTLSVTKLPAGVYYIRFSDKRLKTQRIIKR